MSSFHANIPDFQPRERPSASKLNELADAVEAITQSRVQGVSGGTGFSTAAPDQESFWVQVLTLAVGPYQPLAWKMTSPTEPANWSLLADGNPWSYMDDSMGLSGTATNMPLYEANGQIIPLNTYVRAWRGDGEYYLCNYTPTGGGSGAAQNVNTPLNSTNPLTLLKANNDLGSHAFGRMFWTDNGGGTGQLDWQGLRLYLTGTGYVGPEPDIQFIPGSNISIAITDDATDKRTQVMISATGIPSAATAQNLNTPANTTSPLVTLKANNDMGTAAFGRMFWTNNSTGVGQLDWQGLRVYKSGTGYVGPEPDIEFIAGTGVGISVADDSADKRTQVTITNSAPNVAVLAQNVNAVLNTTNPVTTIKANNDLGNAAFARINWTNSGGGVGQFDWQGLRLYQAGTGSVGPEPDIELVAGTNVTIAIADDPGNKRVKATISAGGVTFYSNGNGSNFAFGTGAYTTAVSLTLPSAGTYIIRGWGILSMQNASAGENTYMRLRDTTNNANIGNTLDSQVMTVQVTNASCIGSVMLDGGAYTVSGATTITFQGQRNSVFGTSTLMGNQNLLSAEKIS